MSPYATYTPSDLWVPTLPASLPIHPWHPLHPWYPWCPQHPETPMPPYATNTPSGSWVSTLPASPQYIHDTPTPLPPQHSLHLLGAPNSPLCYLYPFWPEYLHSLPAPNTPLTHPTPPDTTWCPLMTLNTPLWPPMPTYATCSPSGFWVSIFPASPQYTHDTPWCLPMTSNGPNTLTPLQDPQCPLMPPVPLLAPEYYTPYQPPIHPWHPLHPLMPLMAQHPQRASNALLCHLYPFWLSIVITLQLTIFAQLKTLIFYHCYFQLLSLCNWPSSWVHPIYKMLS